MKISYNWLSTYFTEPLPTPEKLADILTFKLCEVEGLDKHENGDTILDLNILPNRAHDLLSHRGVAREIAGILGLKTKEEIFEHKNGQSTKLAIDIQTPNCRRYSGRVIRGVEVKPSPDWLRERLESVGQRSINNIVDATNYVMFSLGQPCHAFDATKIADLKIEILNAKDGEELPVLGSEKIVAKLKDTDMVIASAGKTLALAGIKGGLESGLADSTEDIVLEVANFAPVAVRKTARRLNLLSDAAKRFENDLSPELVPEAMDMLTELVLELAGGSTEEIVDIYPEKQGSVSVMFTTSYINSILGTKLSETELEKLLADYGYVLSKKGDLFVLAVPSLRLDLTGKHDVAEEVSRLYGLDKIEATPLVVTRKPIVNETLYKIFAVRKMFVDAGYREVITYAFRKKGIYEVARGVGDKGALRTDLSEGLKESYELNRLNAPLLGMTETKLFEIGAVFAKDGEVIHVAFVDKKGVSEMTLDEYFQKNAVTVFDSYGALVATALTDQHFITWSQYPFITRDIAVWVPENVASGQLRELYQKLGTTLLVRAPELFDQFTKDGKTSYAFRLVFQSSERTLVEGDVQSIMDTINTALQERGWEVR
jgi:phenylalanyl-tRNA synthetase beta chain